MIQQIRPTTASRIGKPISSRRVTESRVRSYWSSETRTTTVPSSGPTFTGTATICTSCPGPMLVSGLSWIIGSPGTHSGSRQMQGVADPHHPAVEEHLDQTRVQAGGGRQVDGRSEGLVEGADLLGLNPRRGHQDVVTVVLQRHLDHGRGHAEGAGHREHGSGRDPEPHAGEQVADALNHRPCRPVRAGVRPDRR